MRAGESEGGKLKPTNNISRTPTKSTIQNISHLGQFVSQLGKEPHSKNSKSHPKIHSSRAVKEKEAEIRVKRQNL